MENMLYYGDCLAIMNDEIKRESVDLIYLDPPFNSNKNYNAIYKDSTGKELPEQVNAFCDVWELSEETDLVIQCIPFIMAREGIEDTIVEALQYWMKALRDSQPSLLSYLSYMAIRLLVMRKVLKPTGSIYYHCDPNTSHYVKILMDSIFGYKNFRNEIVWSYQTGGVSKRWFGRKHDIIFLYSKEISYYFNPLKEKTYIPTLKNRTFAKEELNAFIDEEGCNECGQPGGYAKMSYMKDVWKIKALFRNNKERLGYPTQKPLDLLKRIILVSSREGDVVLDPFCGCATTIAASHELKRNWIGIDIAYHAVKTVIQGRLQDQYSLIKGSHYEVDGIPLTEESAKVLWEKSPYQFQRWIIEEVDGFVNPKRTADGGIDGRLWFRFSGKKELDSMVIEVKGGEHVGIGAVRSLRGVLERSNSAMAGLIVRKTIEGRQKQNFQVEIGKAGLIEGYSRMQVLTVKEILKGKKFKTPEVEGRFGRQGVLL